MISCFAVDWTRLGLGALDGAEVVVGGVALLAVGADDAADVEAVEDVAGGEDEDDEPWLVDAVGLAAVTLGLWAVTPDGATVTLGRATVTLGFSTGFTGVGSGVVTGAGSGAGSGAGAAASALDVQTSAARIARTARSGAAGIDERRSSEHYSQPPSFPLCADDQLSADRAGRVRPDARIV